MQVPARIAGIFIALLLILGIANCSVACSLAGCPDKAMPPCHGHHEQGPTQQSGGECTHPMTTAEFRKAVNWSESVALAPLIETNSHLFLNLPTIVWNDRVCGSVLKQKVKTSNAILRI